MSSSLIPGINPAMLPSMAPPPGVDSNFVNPVTLADAIVAVSAITSVLAVIFLSMRLYSTLAITRSASYDDGASILAMIFSLGYVGLIVSTKDDARHGWDFPISAFTASYLKAILSETIIAALGFFFSKVSVLLLLFRLFSPTQSSRYLVYIGIIWASLISLTTLAVAGALCAPWSGESFGSVPTFERCTHQVTWAVAQGALNTILDFYILYLPIPMVWKLNMGQRRKIGVTAIFMTGFIACIASTLSLAYKIKLVKSSDPIWNGARVEILNIVELNIAIMVACMPACASFSRHIITKSGIVSYIKSRISSSKNNKSKSLHPKPITTAADIPSRSTGDPAGGGNYWTLKSPFSSTRDGAPPHITFNKQQSRVLHSGDFKVFGDETGSLALTEMQRNGSVELKEPSFERKQASTALPHDMV
ncbi:MAG: hypothetical protein ALECFALPRED_010874 [Alectoria fallacina]|uniref:Rhodopsin domain-containing protein n=1 Tax=Alectoria fallacina TaxID=1903189 RepID=A0A8H3F1U4_9LECA|nr:MAG: hypothetical protein ALECFALPRED_010874 [Alectoria fallacina]